MPMVRTRRVLNTEGVETVTEWQWLRDNGAVCQQGYLFARPATPAPLPVAPLLPTFAAY